MKNLGITILKVIIVLGLLLGLLNFNRSLSPERNETQKVYDDFVKELNYQGNVANNSSTSPSIGTPKDNSQTPLVLIEFSIKNKRETQTLKYQLIWENASNLKKALRVLDLLHLANVFSLSSIKDPKEADVSIKVISPSGYKFESFLTAADLEKNSSLAIALVLMRELSNNS